MILSTPNIQIVTWPDVMGYSQHYDVTGPWQLRIEEGRPRHHVFPDSEFYDGTLGVIEEHRHRVIEGEVRNVAEFEHLACGLGGAGLLLDRIGGWKGGRRD